MCNEAYATLYVDSIEFYIRDFRAEIVIFFVWYRPTDNLSKRGRKTITCLLSQIQFTIHGACNVLACVAAGHVVSIILQLSATQATMCELHRFVPNHPVASRGHTKDCGKDGEKEASFLEFVLPKNLFRWISLWNTHRFRSH